MVGEILNDLLSAEKSIETKDIYLDDSLRQLFNPENQLFFLQPSTDDRKDFEVKVSGYFEATVSIAKKRFTKCARENN